VGKGTGAGAGAGGVAGGFWATAISANPQHNTDSRAINRTKAVNIRILSQN